MTAGGTPRIGALFAGYGGLEMAVQSVLGGTVAWHSEYEPPTEKNPRPAQAAARILAHHWPAVPNLGDITKVDWSQVEPVDIITAGYPCQPFSAAGHRQGDKDARHLWPFVGTAAARLRPQMLVLENVRGHLTLGFDKVIRDLDWIGYDCRWIVLKASDIGAPHGRARIFIMGVNRGRRLCSRTDRWGGLYRHRGGRGLIFLATQGRNDGQGAARSSTVGVELWGQGPCGPASSRAEPRDALLANFGEGSRRTDIPVTSIFSCQGRACGHRPGIPGDAQCQWSSIERSGNLDGGDTQASADFSRANSGGQSSGSRSGATYSATGSTPTCGSQVGRVVESGRRPVWASAVRREASSQRDDGFRARLRAADVGAPHGRYRVFVVAQPAYLGREWSRSARDGRPGLADLGSATPADTDRDSVRQQPVTEPRRRGPALAGLAGTEARADTDLAGSQGAEPARRRHVPDRGAAADTDDHGRIRRPELNGQTQQPEQRPPLGQHPERRPGAPTATDTSGDGRDARRPEPARLIGGPDAALSGDAATDTERGRRDGRAQAPIGGAVGRTPAAGPGAGVVADASRFSWGIQHRDCEADCQRDRDWRTWNCQREEWDDYGPAIRRWHDLTRCVPDPTELAPKGGQRLSPRFVEWMQGLPAGHVTDPAIGISRNAQLKALGNGVVPQQAAAAVRFLLNVAERAA